MTEKLNHRQEVERKVVRFLVRAMKKNGWIAAKVNDGEEIVKCRTEKDVMDAVFAVDESRIYFKKGDQGRTVIIILGNDGWDCINDHSWPNDEDEFVQIMDKEVTPYCNSLED